MNRLKLRLIPFLAAALIVQIAQAQEPRLDLSGIFSTTYSRSHIKAEANVANPADRMSQTQARELGFGLDLHIGTYIIDPRFIKVSVDTSFARNRGAFDEFDMRYGMTGAGVYVDFLPTSPYPFRFHYNRQDSNFIDRQITSASSGRNSLGFDWQLRKPKLPRLSVTFDDTSYDTKFLAASSFKSHARNFGAGLTDTFKGFEVNANYNNLWSTEGITNLETGQNLARFGARRQLSKNSSLLISSFYDRINFSSNSTGLKQDFSFFDVHTDLDTRHTERLSTRVFHQFYRNTSNVQSVVSAGALAAQAQSVGALGLAAGSALSLDPTIAIYEPVRTYVPGPGTAPIRLLAGGFLSPAALAPGHREISLTGEQQQYQETRPRRVAELQADRTPTSPSTAASIDAALLAGTNTTSSFNAVGGQTSYRLLREVTVSGTVGANFISAPVATTESATRFVDFAGTISWNKRMSIIDTRASYTEGVAYAKSNLGEDRRVGFRSYSAGLSIGDPKYAVISADYNHSFRPDIFQIGGFFMEDYINGSIETQAIRNIRFSASVGEDNVTYLTNRGREQFRRLSYSAGLEHRIVTLLYSHNSNLGQRDVFSVPLDSGTNGLFVSLPIDTLIRNPFLKTSGIYTIALVRVKPIRKLELELRYLKDQAFFITTNNVFGEQFDGLATYRFGKFTVSGGALVQHQTTVGLLMRDRTYYFFRVSRPFKFL